MRLVEFTAIHDANDPTKIVRVRLRMESGADPEPEEWIEAKVAIDSPTVLNGALLRARVLERIRDILSRLSGDFERLGRASCSCRPVIGGERFILDIERSA